LINIVVLAAGKPRFENPDEEYPLLLTEIDGKPLVNNIVESNKGLQDCRYIFVLRKDDVEQFHLDNAVKQLSEKVEIIIIDGETGGAACSALLAIEWINNENELLILSADEYTDESTKKIVTKFKDLGYDAGTIIFDSIHPRYSYLKLDQDNLVIEAAEKNPISNNATVGFYWFKVGSEFVSGAKNLIRKEASVNGAFYICPVFNEFILNQKRIGVHKVEASKYHPIKSERQLNQIGSS